MALPRSLSIWAGAILLGILVLYAVEGIRVVRSREIEDPGARLAAGLVHFEHGRFDEAARIFEEIVRADPSSADALMNLGVTYYRLNRYLGAADAFKRFILLKPTSAQAYARLGFALSQMNIPHEAIESFKAAISYRPDLAQAHWGLGLAYRQLGFYEEAIASFRKVILLQPNFADARFNLAEACLITKRKCTAIDEYLVLKELDEELAAQLFDLIMQ